MTAAPVASPARPSRIGPVDGLRAIAVLGVLYAHVWSFALGTPAWRVFGVDVNRGLSLFGTGVDLFFVISGFCMYLMYGSRQTAFRLPAYAQLLANRFRRIAPAFYVAAVVSALFATARGNAFPVAELLTHVTFVFQVVPTTNQLAASFWSLGTEWHFYLLLPAIVHFAHRYGFRRAMAASIGTSIALRFAWRWWGGDVPGVQIDHLIPFRFVEFGWGMVAADLHLRGTKLPRLLHGAPGFVLGWAISLCGRAMMTERAGTLPWGTEIQAVSIVLLSFGYMLVVWNVVASQSIFSDLLSSGVMRWLGKISYSLYLWHWDVGLTSIQSLAKILGSGAWAPIGYTLLSLVWLVPLSALSYRLLEAAYFRRGRTAPRAVPTANST